MIHSKVNSWVLFIWLLFFFTPDNLYAQRKLITIVPSLNQLGIIYTPSLSERNEIDEISNLSPQIPVWISSIVPGVSETFTFRFNGTQHDDLKILRKGSTIAIPKEFDAPNDFRFQLTATNKDELLYFLHHGDTAGVLFTKVYQKQIERIRIVPLMAVKLSKDSISTYLNKFYRNAGLSFDVVIDTVFKHQDVRESQIFRNPSKVNDRFTARMRSLRDLYLSIHPEQKGEYLVFVIPGFVDPKIKGYMVRNKALGFLKRNSNKQMAISLAEQLEFGMAGISVEEFRLIKKSSVLHLGHWERIRRHHGIYSYFDDYEDLRTNSGIVAYYFWDEDALGNIRLSGKHPLQQIIRPYKKNTFSYHLEIRHFFYKTLFVVKNRTISLIHILCVFLSVASMYFIGRKFRAWFRKLFKRPFFFVMGSRFLEWISALVLGYFSLSLADLGYGMYEVRSGDLKVFANKPLQTVISQVGSGIHPKKLAEPELASEILVRKQGSYEVRQRKRVLYFSISLDRDGFIEKMQLVNTEDTLHVESLGISKFAQSHYIVLHYRDFSGKHIKDEVYNHLGVNLTQKIKLKDPPKRILVFVNGYRPTSLGSSLEENFKDVQNNGLEFPNSYNRIFAQDEYQYWHPWNAIDVLFSARINPTETYYADGHFSVSTSNYRSLINFTTTASTYPKRCASNKNHHCYSVKTVKSKFFGSKQKKTYSMLASRSNKKGFLLRRENGRVAGRNLLQLLNEMPNSSRNDTLYLVAHSMGYAYSLGMMDVLRGQMQFGGCFIIAPENASAGKVYPEEWKEIWQYGSNFEKVGREAPCLQDGVAPQVAVAGLPNSKRVFIPRRIYQLKGFFDSHFVGYYTWIFDIPKGQRGAIKQH